MARLAIALVATVTAVAATMGSASAATGTSAKAVTVANLQQSNYRSPITYVAPSSTAKSITPQVTGNGSSISATHSVTVCPQDCASLVQSFSTTYDVSIGIITSCFQNMNGSGYAAWDGSVPFDANKMTLAQNVWVSGVGVSISVGGSVGAGFSVSNNTVYFSESATNTWQLSHSFTNLKFCTKVGAIGPYENSRDSATFGTHTYTDFIN